MKTLRMTRSVETRNGHRAMVARGRASLSRGALFDQPVVLTGRRFRRANKLTHAEVGLLNVLARRPNGIAILPTIELETDERTRAIRGWRRTA